MFLLIPAGTPISLISEVTTLADFTLAMAASTVFGKPFGVKVNGTQSANSAITSPGTTPPSYLPG